MHSLEELLEKVERILDHVQTPEGIKLCYELKKLLEQNNEIQRT